jgi:anthranilate synthase/aminodeoxychorismate synthase-like glutamine amidotransferase
MTLVVIDNYDSFTYNLVQYFGELGTAPQVYRNDALTLDALEALGPTRLVVSPGPGDPDDGGISNAAILRFAGRIPILGVCLGHQCLGAVYGGTVQRAPRLMHGKTSRIHHHGTGLFANIPSPFEATRYHSLIVAEPVPASLEVTAFTTEGEVMGLRHREHPTFGVQFHPESILTQHGKDILQNFLEI